MLNITDGKLPQIGYQISLAGPKFKPNNKSETTVEVGYEEICHAVKMT